MPMPFDATLKELLRYVPDWLSRIGVVVQDPIEEISADLSNVSATADKVFRIGEEPPWLLHIESQASRDVSLPQRALKYNALLHDLVGLPVHTVAILLRREADDVGLTGTISYQRRPELGGMQFAYRVVRVWEWPVEQVLAGGLGTLPLAPLSAEVTKATLPGVIQRMEARLQAAEPGEAAKLWTATLVLSGLRFDREIMLPLLQGVRGMKESDTYQAIVEEGEIKGIRETLLSLGRIRFGGPPSRVQEATLSGIIDLGRLHRMRDQLLQVESWQELLATT